MKRLVLLMLVCVLLTGLTGCRCVNQLLCGGISTAGPCDSTHCTDDCGPVCAESGVDACGGDCGATCSDCAPADPCGPSCGSGCGHCGPLALVLSLFRCEAWCGSGCGETYWGEFHSDPPDCCDPCDQCGNFTGGTSTVGISTDGTVASSCGCEATAETIGLRQTPRGPHETVRR